MTFNTDGWLPGTWWPWAAFILPQFENGTLYNAINFTQPTIAAIGTVDFNSTVWMSVVRSYLCPSDSVGSGTMPNMNWVCPAKPHNQVFTGAVTNYVVCMGDNKWGNPVFDIYSSEPGGPQYGCNGTFTGLFGDCSSGLTKAIRDCTDGTSNTFLAGENSSNLNGALMWVNGNASYASTDIPLNWWSNLKDGQVDPTDGTTCSISQLGNTLQALHCWRNQTVNYGFKSWHPGGANFTMADASVRFIKNSINPRTYNALGTRANAEIISSDAY